ncbi:MAG: DUF5103 domain-containing protein [Bacteroidales bacterium]|nr:DUF5103 domain-containing protein [Bacteroidales bacterium]
MKIKKLLAAAILAGITPSMAQTADEYQAQDVKTVEFRKTGTDLGMPICTLGESLTLSFDVLNDQYQLAYSVQHCDADFAPDDLQFYEFADGFDNREIYDYKNSFNTHSVFTHYVVNIPNDDITLKISGNYIIKIYDRSDPENVILQKKFMVAEPETQLAIDIETERPFLAEYSITHQQIKANINNSRQRMSNPAGFLKVYVSQNGDINHRHHLEYNFTDAYNIRFHHNDGANLFYGGNEFLYFDAKDVNFKALGIDKIEYTGNRYRYILSVHSPTDVSYSFREDLDGQFYVKNDRGFNRDLESDYIEVVFRLKYPPLFDGKMYVSGELTNYSFTAANQMTYNNVDNLYECTLLLKQGLYNYTFVIIHDDGTMEYPDGSWYNTENKYLITIYNTDYNNRGDRLMAYRIVNTMK